ncbi:hypothetical protein V8E36_008612 [Tilletia maclaganii]
MASSSRRAVARIAKEVHALCTAPLPGIRLSAHPHGSLGASSSGPSSRTTNAEVDSDADGEESFSASPLDDLQHLHAWIRGPPDTPYAGGYFAVEINIEDTPAFPDVPPHCKFVTPIFHPNISRDAGEICVSTLKKDWKPEYGIRHILLTIKCLLIAPNPDSALEPESARLLQEEYGEYCRIARLWTSVHASAAKCPPRLFADEKDDDGPSIPESSARGTTSIVTDKQSLAGGSKPLVSVGNVPVAAAPINAQLPTKTDNDVMAVDDADEERAGGLHAAASQFTVAVTTSTPPSISPISPQGISTSSSTASLPTAGSTAYRIHAQFPLPAHGERDFEAATAIRAQAKTTGLLGAGSRAASPTPTSAMSPATSTDGRRPALAIKRGLKRL